MSERTIYVTITRVGKSPTTISVPSMSTVETVVQAAGIAQSDYSSWNFTDEDGDVLGLGSRLENSTALICGVRVDGA